MPRLSTNFKTSLGVKQVTFLLIMVMAMGQLHAGNIFFVKQNSHGNGTSWMDAFGSLQQALNVAQTGDAIWVARGEYFTTSGNNRNLYFRIKDGVKLYGGFAGTESSLAQRNIGANRTILSGEIGTSSLEDNAYTVVFTENVSSNTVVDGFIITGGTANVEQDGSSQVKESCGAGWYNLANGAHSSPIIRNCKFVDNKAREGAGMYNLAINGGECSPIIEKSQFIQNTAALDGGAIYNGTLGANSKAAPKLTNVQFEYNIATYGGGMMNHAHDGQVAPLVKQCRFISNKAHFQGAGVYNDYKGEGSSKAVMIACVLQKNLSSIGEPVSSRTGSFKGGSISSNGLR